MDIERGVLHALGQHEALALGELHGLRDEPGQQVVGLGEDRRRLEAHVAPRRGTTIPPSSCRRSWWVLPWRACATQPLMLAWTRSIGSSPAANRPNSRRMRRLKRTTFGRLSRR